MTIIRRALVVSLGVALLAMLPSCAERAEKPVSATPQGNSAKIFAATLPDLDGKPQPMKQWQGKILVLNFWAPWCPPCRAEMPEFVELQEKYREQGVVFVGVALDQKDKVQAFVDELGVNYPMLLGADNAAEIGKLAGNRLGGLPFTAIFAKNGDIVSTVTGELKRAQLEAALKPLL